MSIGFGLNNVPPRNVFRYCDSLSSLLGTTTASDLSLKRPFEKWLLVDSTTTVAATLKIFQENKLTSIPIRDVFTNYCTGFIDLLDILAFLIKCCSSPINNSDQLLQIWNQFSLQEVGQLTDYIKRNPYIPFTQNQTIFEIFNSLFEKNMIGSITKVPILELNNSELKIVQILSYSRVNNFVAEHNSALDRDWVTRNLDNVFNQSKWGKVPTILPNVIAIDAFNAMYRNGLPYLAIVDQMGQLVGNVSATDLEGLATGSFDRLFLPITDYLKEFYKDVNEIMTPPIVVKLVDTLESVVLKLAASLKHRVYVIDNSNRPIGVITLIDIMELLVVYIRNQQNNAMQL